MDIILIIVGIVFIIFHKPFSTYIIKETSRYGFESSEGFVKWHKKFILLLGICFILAGVLKMFKIVK